MARIVAAQQGKVYLPGDKIGDEVIAITREGVELIIQFQQSRPASKTFVM